MDNENEKNQKYIKEMEEKIFNKRKIELDKILNVSGKGNYESNMLSTNLPDSIKENIGQSY